MKELIKEARRMQQLAGLLKEDLDESPVDDLITAYLVKVGLTLTPEERAKFTKAIEMDYEEGDISRATMEDLNDIFGASGIRAIEDDEDDEPGPRFDIPYDPTDDEAGRGDWNIGRGRG